MGNKVASATPLQRGIDRKNISWPVGRPPEATSRNAVAKKDGSNSGVGGGVGSNLWIIERSPTADGDEAAAKIVKVRRLLPDEEPPVPTRSKWSYSSARSTKTEPPLLATECPASPVVPSAASGPGLTGDHHESFWRRSKRSLRVAKRGSYNVAPLTPETRNSGVLVSDKHSSSDSGEGFDFFDDTTSSTEQDFNDEVYGNDDADEEEEEDIEMKPYYHRIYANHPPQFAYPRGVKRVPKRFELQQCVETEPEKRPESAPTLVETEIGDFDVVSAQHHLTFRRRTPTPRHQANPAGAGPRSVEVYTIVVTLVKRERMMRPKRVGQNRWSNSNSPRSTPRSSPRNSRDFDEPDSGFRDAPEFHQGASKSVGKDYSSGIYEKPEGPAFFLNLEMQPFSEVISLTVAFGCND
ncbi:unnamed protein product [Notodromas monacha]|uniref:Uncharacterized protein n=1 Tax=Notodromas monacha TaxID=399045 RepID=A0A7R9BEQ7_9CRUS|nr:unnamed protein product [Notodromas monacha]CAG0913451.1 unnamed protein product [Notodromas monacha]